MRQASFYIEYGSYQGFKASPDNESERHMYSFIIKENDAIKLRIGIPTSVTLNPRVSGIDKNNVYGWLWNQGLNFLHIHEKEHQINDIKLIIDDELVKNGEVSAPWEQFIVNI